MSSSSDSDSSSVSSLSSSSLSLLDESQEDIRNIQLAEYADIKKKTAEKKSSSLKFRIKCPPGAVKSAESASSHQPPSPKKKPSKSPKKNKKQSKKQSKKNNLMNNLFQILETKNKQLVQNILTTFHHRPPRQKRRNNTVGLKTGHCI